MIMYGTWSTFPMIRLISTVICVFNKKIASDNTLSSYTARLVAQGFSQKYGINYDKILGLSNKCDASPT